MKIVKDWYCNLSEPKSRDRYYSHSRTLSMCSANNGHRPPVHRPPGPGCMSDTPCKTRKRLIRFRGLCHYIQCRMLFEATPSHPTPPPDFDRSTSPSTESSQPRIPPATYCPGFSSSTLAKKCNGSFSATHADAIAAQQDTTSIWVVVKIMVPCWVP